MAVEQQRGPSWQAAFPARPRWRSMPSVSLARKGAENNQTFSHFLNQLRLPRGIYIYIIYHISDLARSYKAWRMGIAAGVVKP